MKHLARVVTLAAALAGLPTLHAQESDKGLIAC